METISLFLVALSTFTVTSYRSTASQTDATPYVTSIGEKVGSYGIAVSQELLCPLIRHSTLDSVKKHSAKTCPYHDYLHYGDILYIEGVGFKTINDCMGMTHVVNVKKVRYVTINGKKVKQVTSSIARVPQRHAIDVWVATYKEEHAFQTKHLMVYLVRDSDPKLAHSTGPLKDAKVARLMPTTDDVSHWWTLGKTLSKSR